jgi:hypothetical protein
VGRVAKIYSSYLEDVLECIVWEIIFETEIFREEV